MIKLTHQAETDEEMRDTVNLDLAQILRSQLTYEQRALLVNALDDHHDKLRHNDSNIIGQLYDGDADIVSVSADLLATLRRAQ